uniref:NADH dehydrogenase subunit 6 n=1 Tax=Ambigolimax valentianus TaxID=1338344 RepID=UPI002411256A|nr:NADH dehydrogenase subunit 6 [Ambigolimax valentianus]WEI33074.1 NADH dehydrogenase subunit 6 [Ambigolimax valentianus]
MEVMYHYLKLLNVLWVVLLSSLISMFVLVSSPMGVGVLLFMLSLLMAVKMGMMISSWYAYMLFLVYVGGLLVMFIYICMISSNYQLGVSKMKLLLPLTLMNLAILSQYTINQKLVTFSGLSINGMNLPLFLLLMLGVYLLICFIVVINIIFMGGSNIELEN